MAQQIPMPDLGTTVDKIVLKRWLKRTGDAVKRGDPLVEVETDKALMEVESAAEGTLLRREFAEGDTVEQGQIIAVIGAPDESAPKLVGSEIKLVAKKKAKTPAAARPAWIARRGELPAGAEIGALKKDKAFLLNLYRRMVLIRRFEERVKYLFLEGVMPGTIHQCQGQEASAVGVCAALREGDVITTTHRPHGHCIARGLPVESLMHELFGKPTGCCHGKGGSMHMGDLAAGVLPAIAIVGGNIPIATGIALSYKMRGQPNVAVCFMGDGATNEGTFHESLNMASLWDLPVLYVVENNRYAASTAVGLTMKVERISDRAAAYAMPGLTIDGNDVWKVFETAQALVERARTGGGPTLLEVETYRLTGHSRRDPGHYQPDEEKRQWRDRDPIPNFATRLTENGTAGAPELERIEEEVDEEIERAVRSAMAAPDADPGETLTDVFA